MIILYELLQKLKKITEHNDLEKELINSVFLKTIGSPVKHFTIKNNILFIKENPYIKSEIVLHKEQLIKELNREGLESTIKDIQ